MSTKKNHISKFNNQKIINNNMETFYFSKEKQIVNTYQSDNIKNKINKFLSSPFYIYGIDVIINVKGKEIKEKIIAIKDDKVYTIDNKAILIKDIRDISLNKFI